MDNIEISGPYAECSLPFGFGKVSLSRDSWFVSRILSPKERKTPCQKITGSKSLGVIVRFEREKRRFIISQLFPVKAFSSLRKAVAFLVKNEGKIVFCS